SGGPGTVVHLTGGDNWDPPVKIFISKVAVSNSSSAEPPSQPLAVVQFGKGSVWTATFTMPSTWSTGEPIAPGVIYILADDVDVHPFNFTLSTMPPTGRNTVPIWFTIGLLG